MPAGGNNVETARKVEVFRPGTFTAMDGRSYSFSADDVAAMAENYDAENAPAPVVVGHPKTDDPAFGWASGFEVNEEGKLVASVDRLAPAFVTAVEEGRYRKVSMKFFEPMHPANPTPGQYYPRHIGFLGGAAPAVSGLAPVQFSDAEDEGMVEFEYCGPAFADKAFEDVGSLFRKMREFFIEKYSREEADQVMPEWRISWIEDAAKDPVTETDAGFVTPKPETKKDDPMADEADLEAREAKLKEGEAALINTQNVAFVDGLVEAGKLIAASKDDAVTLCNELALSETDLSFADGGNGNPLDLLKSLLEAQPEVVPMGDVAGDDVAPAQGSAAFATADGEQVDTEGLELHAKALAYQAEHPGTAYIDAALAVQGA